MKVDYRLKLGQDEFLITFEAKNEKEFFEQASFYSNLPRVAPGGSDDLKIVFRKTKKGHRYYSLLSEKEKQEYKFGQHLEANGNGLFGKGWEPAYQSDNEDGDEVQGSGGLGIGATQPQAQVQTTGLGIQSAPKPTAAAPQPAQPAFVMPTPVAMPAPIVAAQTAPQPLGIATIPTAVQPAAVAVPIGQPAVSPQIATAASDVLKRFGIPSNK